MHPRRPALALLAIAALVALPLALLPGGPVDAARPAKASPTATASATTYLEGIDVSQWQGTIDWAQVVGAGKGFAFIRASAGTLTSDTTYATNIREARRVGIPAGAYHFANPDSATNDAVNEANWFLQNASIARGDLIPVLDVEVTNGLSVSKMQAWVSAWLERVRTVTGLRAIIYTSPNFWKTYLGDTRQFADAGYTTLWVAHWGATSPSVPASNWGGRGWTFWQYSSTGQVAGIAGDVDLDRYRGTSLPASLFIP